MPKQKRRQNINFRQTASERSATQSYRNFGANIKRKAIRVVRGK